MEGCPQSTAQGPHRPQGPQLTMRQGFKPNVGRTHNSIFLLPPLSLAQRGFSSTFRPKRDLNMGPWHSVSRGESQEIAMVYLLSPSHSAPAQDEVATLPPFSSFPAPL